MKPALLAALLAAPAAAAPGLEASRAAAERSFHGAPAASREFMIDSFGAMGMLPRIQPAPPPVPALRQGKEVKRVDLAKQLDQNLHLMTRQLGAKAWEIGSVGDLASKNYFLTFSNAGGMKIEPVGDVNRLRGKGINVKIDPSTTYNFRLQVSLPIKNSILHMSPVAPTAGPAHRTRVFELLAAIKARSTVAVVDRVEFWIQYGHDVLPDGSGLAKTRSFLFIHEAGMQSKAWMLAEDSLKVGEPAQIDLGGTAVILTRTAGGQLIVASAN